MGGVRKRKSKDGKLYERGATCMKEGATPEYRWTVTQIQGGKRTSSQTSGESDMKPSSYHTESTEERPLSGHRREKTSEERVEERKDEACLCLGPIKPNQFRAHVT